MSTYPNQASAPPQPGSYNSGYYQSPPAYGQPMTTIQYAGNYQTTTVLVNPGIPIMVRHPVTVQCPQCRATVTTSVSYEIGAGAWLIVAVIFVLGFWCGCCLIPLCINACKDAIHTCPNCHNCIGKKGVI